MPSTSMAKKKQDNLPAPINQPQTNAPQGPGTPNVIAVSASKTEVFSGPLPPPEYLERYERVNPGAAQQIFTTFQQLSSHQMEMEKQALTADSSRSTLGVTAGFIISMTLIIGGVFCISLGHDWAGSTIIVSCVATLAGVFVHGRMKKKQAEN
jgi:uncharacterized membrane protein